MITAIIITKNEENNIERCLRSLSFCDEIIVIDDLSTDKTKDIAQQHGVKFISHPLNNDFAAQRNFGLNLAKSKWVLFIDADEVVSSKLAQSIRAAVQNEDVEGFYIHRHDEMFGKSLKYGELKDKKFLRLAQKNAGTWMGLVHEAWKIEGKTKTLHETLMHYPHQTLYEFIQEINFYTTLRAYELYTQGSRSSMLQIIFYTKAKFIHTYFIKGGFLDGMPGLIYSLCMSLHSFLTRSKLYLLEKRNT